jgi:NADH dehydrogenase FAD-containing subunit
MCSNTQVLLSRLLLGPECLLINQYPKLLESEVKVTVIQSRDHILNTYAEKISEYAEARFDRTDITIVKNARYVGRQV